MGSKGSRLFASYVAILVSVFVMIGFVVLPYANGNEIILVFLAVTIGFIICLILIYHLFENYIKPVVATSRVAKELVKGNYNARTYVKPQGEAAHLSNAINVLAKSLQEMTIQEKMQGSQWKTVINNMESGLMLIDERGYVHLVNRKLLDLFGEKSVNYIGYLYYDVLSQVNIQKVVQETFLYEEKIKSSFVKKVGNEKRYIEIVGAPVINETNELKGAVLVFHDITELKRVEQMRKDFVANVSHELKTPITSIRGFAETLLDGAMEDTELSKQFLTIILSESERLQALVYDLLELSRLEKDELKLTQKRIEIHEWIQGIITIAEQQAVKKDIEFSYTIDEQISLNGDADRLKQVLLNLLYNAINYTAEKGKVGLVIEETKDMILFKVRDTGLGIPESAKNRIFERFYRVDRARSRNTGGTGLGLAIVKHIVEAHNGEITVDSKLDEGSTFIVKLPKHL
ncbi:two-component system histidine kinase PnpS [Saliterribacillus persicus]|uniref:histidine kinase n=1 Tax=Saliterribacillus persicus TaxID=930114 RepID=A0A368XEB6_9BACI|nr:HAMP domain-containing sensor histidine kinase [Saliterribacillus persicus]RCW66321.1 PAS/PAC sensor signal transduction histidine kinase [Saliterribacillus persicus]